MITHSQSFPIVLRISKSISIWYFLNASMHLYKGVCPSVTRSKMTGKTVYRRGGNSRWGGIEITSVYTGTFLISFFILSFTVVSGHFSCRFSEVDHILWSSPILVCSSTSSGVCASSLCFKFNTASYRISPSSTVFLVRHAIKGDYFGHLRITHWSICSGHVFRLLRWRIPPSSSLITHSI